MDEDAKLDRLRSQITGFDNLIQLERERAMLSAEILEAILVRLTNIERRLDKWEHEA